MKKERLATYTVEVPLKFTFATNSDLGFNELYALALKELYKRLDNGYFDLVEKKLDIVNKVIHYTKEELAEQERIWKEIKKGLVKNGI